MSEIYYKTLERRQKLHIRTYALLCLILIVSMGYYSFKKWQDYSAAKDGIAQNKALITEMQKAVTTEKTAYEAAKPALDQLSDETSKNLKTIFPATDDYTNLTRQIDSYEHTLSSKNDIFEVSNIDYQNIVETDHYRVLPFRMNIRSARDNFTKFLHLVETSGALKNNIRLMDVSSIKLNFESSADSSSGNGSGSGKSGAASSDLISFSVQINAYFQK